MTQARRTKTAGSSPTSSKGVEPRTRLHADVRSKMIVEAAFRAIAKDGFEGLRTRDIAALVGINSATLHHHFPTKDDLIAAVASHLQSHFRLEKTPAVAGESAADALERQFKDAVFYFQRRPEMIAVYREFVIRAPRDRMIRRLVQQLHDGWQKDVAQIVKRGQQDGSFRADLNRDATCSLIICAVWGLIAQVFRSVDDFSVGFQELTKWIKAGQGSRA